MNKVLCFILTGWVPAVSFIPSFLIFTAAIEQDVEGKETEDPTKAAKLHRTFANLGWG